MNNHALLTNYNERLAMRFISEVWNGKNLHRLSDFLHSGFRDYSLPVGYQNKTGAYLYLDKLNEVFNHFTTIDQIASEDDLVYLQFTILLRPARQRPTRRRPTRLRPIQEGFLPGAEESHISGYRCFKIKHDKIVAHWEVIDVPVPLPTAHMHETSFLTHH